MLISNAGLVPGERRITPDGLEHVFALNHLAPFLLTNLLLPKLTASAPARVVTVTSDAHSAARPDLNDPNLERGRDSWRSSANSKLASILFTRELARRLDGTRGNGQLRAPGGSADRLRPAVQAAAEARHHDRPAVHGLARARRGHHRVPGQFAGGGGPDRRTSEKLTGLAPAQPAGS